MHRGSASAGRLGRAGLRMRVRNRYIVARAHRGTGQIPALIAEDFSDSVKDAIRGHFRYALTRIGAVIDGVRGR
jgi:hypothetical protein